MLRVISSLIIFGLFLVNVNARVVEDDFDEFDINNINVGIARLGDEVLTRQCTCDEVYECFLETWEHIGCQFANTFLTETRKQNFHKVFANCSTASVEGYCTSEGLNHVYFKNDEYGYNSTEEIETVEEDAYHICFIQETIKCFHRSQCDIQNHTLALMDARLDCKKREDRWMMGLAISSASKVQAEKMRESWFIKYNETFKSIDEMNQTLSKKVLKSDAANSQINNIILFSAIMFFFNIFLYLQ